MEGRSKEEEGWRHGGAGWRNRGMGGVEVEGWRSKKCGGNMKQEEQRWRWKGERWRD